MKTISVLGYVGMTGGLLALVFMRGLFSPSPVVIIVQAAAACLLLWARITFGRRSFHAVADPTEGGLVTTGPYRYIRHPIYTAVCLFVGAGVAAHFSWKTALAFACVLAGAIMRMRCEETLVTVKYPAYTEYAARTARMIPGLF